MRHLFTNRQHAGECLAQKTDTADIVIAIPRGGIPIGAPICQKTGAMMALTFPRKLRVPNQEEFAFGAINAQGDTFINHELCKRLNISDTYIESEKQFQIEDIAKRRELYQSPTTSLHNKTAIIVDDGIATGMTMLAAIASVKHQNPKEIIVAIPVSPPDALQTIQEHAQVICLHTPSPFGAVGNFYAKFGQVDTQEAQAILKAINKI